jgi:hypothetical protein
VSDQLRGEKIFKYVPYISGVRLQMSYAVLDMRTAHCYTITVTTGFIILFIKAKIMVIIIFIFTVIIIIILSTTMIIAEVWAKWC